MVELFCSWMVLVLNHGFHGFSDNTDLMNEGTWSNIRDLVSSRAYGLIASTCEHARCT